MPRAEHLRHKSTNAMSWREPFNMAYGLGAAVAPAVVLCSTSRPGHSSYSQWWRSANLAEAKLRTAACLSMRAMDRGPAPKPGRLLQCRIGPRQWSSLHRDATCAKGYVLPRGW